MRMEGCGKKVLPYSSRGHPPSQVRGANQGKECPLR